MHSGTTEQKFFILNDSVDSSTCAGVCLCCDSVYVCVILEVQAVVTLLWSFGPEQS